MPATDTHGDGLNTRDGTRKLGLPPVIPPGARVLILGSLPSDASLRRREYYANPRNQFWMLVGAAYERPLGESYEERLDFLAARGVALWDVLAGANRIGSLDAAIRDPRPNDLLWLLAEHPGLSRVGLNGRKASDLYRRHVAPVLRKAKVVVTTADLPSSSPVPGRNVLSFERKVEVYREFLLG